MRTRNRWEAWAIGGTLLAAAAWAQEGGEYAGGSGLRYRGETPQPVTLTLRWTPRDGEPVEVSTDASGRIDVRDETLGDDGAITTLSVRAQLHRDDDPYRTTLELQPWSLVTRRPQTRNVETEQGVRSTTEYIDDGVTVSARTVLEPRREALLYKGRRGVLTATITPLPADVEREERPTGRGD